jgi:hypothetical protein
MGARDQENRRADRLTMQIGFPVRPMKVDCQILPLHAAEIAQSRAQAVHPGCRYWKRNRAQESNLGNLPGLLSPVSVQLYAILGDDLLPPSAL